MTFTAKHFLHELHESALDDDFSGAVKTFKASRGQSQDAAANLNAARHNLERSQDHDQQAHDHEGMAVAAKAQGNKSLAQSHTEAAGHHAALSATHADLAAGHMKKAKTAQNLGEASRGFADPNDLVSFEKYNMHKSPASRGELDNPRPKHGQSATLQDLRDVANEVAQRHQARLELVRVLGEAGFVFAFVIPGGAYLGTTSPSVSDVQQEMIQVLRERAPAAVVDLLTQDEILSGSGPNARRLIFRFRLREHDFGGF
jgi:hypothetical protein